MGISRVAYVSGNVPRVIEPEVFPGYDLRTTMSRLSGPETIKAILTDVQFWIPALVLAGGIVLLVILH